jgi:ATP-dependent helicase/nuclease subunit B
MRLLLELPEKGGYFRPLADHPTMAEALWSTIRELRMAGIGSSGLKDEAFTSPAKRDELRTLLGAYEQFLARTNRGDMAAVYQEAVTHSDWCPIQPADCWTELPDVTWAPLQQRLLEILPGERIVPHALALPGVATPRRLSDRQIERVTPEIAVAPLGHLLGPADASRSRAKCPATIELFHAGGREAEIEEVFRRILASGDRLDHIEIACASDAHVSLIWEKALRHEWPVTLGPGIAATQTRPGRALIGLCDWIETDFSAAQLRRLLQSGDMGIEEDDEGFTAGQAARVLGRAGAGWGRATYELALGQLVAAYMARATDPDASDADRADARAKADLTSKVLAWIKSLLVGVPQPDDSGRVPLQAIVEGAIAFIDHTTARKSALDHRAGEALLEHVSELRALGSFACPLGEALRFIRERVQGLQVAPERPRPGHLYVCSLSQTCYSGRPHVYVVGLEEGRVFSTAREDAVLLDGERTVISPALRTSSDSVDESVYVVLGRLATWSPQPEGSITFSYSCRDTREFRETYASWLMLQAYRLQQGDAAGSYPQMKVALGEPTSLVPSDRSRAASSSGWWLRSIVGTADRGAGIVTETFSAIAQGCKAQQAKDSDAFTEYDGYVPAAGEVLDPCASRASFSVTELESAAACPFRFFLKRGLGVRVLDERERDRDVWLDPLTRGSELHDLYASVLRRCRDEKRRPDCENDGAWLKSRAQARLKELHRQMPAATPEILDRESNEFLADLDLFIEAECKCTDERTPIGFEVSFGRPLEDEHESLAQAEPIEIDLGKGLTFRIAGRIDRIDKVGASSFEVLDYKTGGYWPKSWEGVFAGGRRLQHALYGLAAVQLLRHQYKKATISAGVYYFPSRKGRRERVRIPAPSQAAIAAVLADLRATIRAGAFAHAVSDDDCTFCDYAAACDQSIEARSAEAKLETSELRVYGRLGAHA